MSIKEQSVETTLTPARSMKVAAEAVTVGQTSSETLSEPLPRTVFPLLGREIPLPSSLRALGHRNFRLFWTGQLISLVGTWMQMIARGWLVLELTQGSPFWLG